jgi:hypothetical protein
MRLLVRRQFLTLIPGLVALFRPPPPPDPTDDPAWLARWKSAPRHPVWQSPDPTTRHLLAAIHHGTPTEIAYRCGTNPGEPRRVKSIQLKTHQP